MTIAYADLAELFPLETVRMQLRIDADAEDVLLEQFIAVAAEAVESDTGHLFTARAVTEGFAAFGEVRLRSWPINAVTAIGYFDAGGAAQSLDPETVRVASSRRPARLVSLTGALPVTSGAIDGVSVTMNAGYVEAEDVPMRLRQAVLLMVGDMYKQRESFVTGASVTEVPMSLPVDLLLRPFRIIAL